MTFQSLIARADSLITPFRSKQMLLQWNLDHILYIQKFRYTSGSGSSSNMLLSDYESILKGAP